jgi:four helix bundle protein
VSKIQRFEDFEAWQKGRELTNMLYGLSANGAFSRDFVLRDQVRRAVVSVMANTAEGYERGGDKEFLQFLSVAKGSCGELRSHLCVALAQRYLTDAQYRLACDKAMEVSRLISGLMRYLRQSPMRGSKYR